MAMNRQQLIDDLERVPRPGPDEARAFAEAADGLAAALNRVMMARPDLDDLLPPERRAMMEENGRNLFRFMGAIAQAFDAEMLVDTVLWVVRTYRAHGFQPAYWPVNLDVVMAVMRENLDTGTSDALLPLFRWLAERMPDFMALSEAAAAGEAVAPR